jgi:hypothetical protein
MFIFLTGKEGNQAKRSDINLGKEKNRVCYKVKFYIKTHLIPKPRHLITIYTIFIIFEVKGKNVNYSAF